MSCNNAVDCNKQETTPVCNGTPQAMMRLAGTMVALTWNQFSLNRLLTLWRRHCAFTIRWSYCWLLGQGTEGKAGFMLQVTGKTIATNCAAPSIWCCSYCRCLQFSLEALETGRSFQRDASLSYSIFEILELQDSGVQDREIVFYVVYDILQWNNDITACTLQQEVYIILSKFFAVKCSNRQLCGLSCPRLLVVYLRISLQCCGSGRALTIVEAA